MPDVAKDTRVKRLIKAALDEDIGRGDATTSALVPAGAMGRAVILARNAYIVCGATVAAATFRMLDPSIRCRILVPDGKPVKRGGVIMRIEGRARAILTVERTALNFLQRMTGIATLTRRFVDKVRGYGVDILDTRKTSPLLRVLEKYAVKCGGGVNHRFGLYDRILMKDNHCRLWGRGSLDKAVLAARKRYPRLMIEVEVENESGLKSALKAKPDWIMLDNMSPARMKKCVKIAAGRAKVEASGGITFKNVVAAARTGVDAISLGCLTHSAPAADLSLEIA